MPVAPRPVSKPVAAEPVSSKHVALKPVSPAPTSLKPVSNAGVERTLLAAEREALPKLAYRVASPKPAASMPVKPVSNDGAGRSSHVTDRKALPTLTYRPASHRNQRLQPAVVEEVIRNVEPEPVVANMVPQVSTKFLEGFKQALLPVDQNRKLDQETRQGQSKHAQRTPIPGMHDGRYREMHAPNVETRGQEGSSRPSRNQNRQGRVPEICESNLHVVVPAIIEIFLEKLRHKEGVVEKVAKLYAGNGNKLVEELRGSHYKDQRVLAETYDHRRQEFIKKCDKTMQRVQIIRDAMDGCVGDVASSPDLRTAAVERVMVRLREARA
ncbi:hypothetical protein F5X68DRAFT_201994 [Plectosphaerella plurivora]|uniref:Uncharacterized protein n=1 Tax=Plectosphaerella plurivora TaxID=936078 RepID=A0A9P9AAS6_9PEZI|nr:hypothetical protein F5X68DRAFT_201994 [Plectosphaerella plurivora]